MLFSPWLFLLSKHVLKYSLSDVVFFSLQQQRTSLIACLCCCLACRHSHACSSGESRIPASRDRVCVLSSGQSRQCLFTHVFLSRLFHLPHPNPRPLCLSFEMMGNLSQVVFSVVHGIFAIRIIGILGVGICAISRKEKREVQPIVYCNCVDCTCDRPQQIWWRKALAALHLQRALIGSLLHFNTNTKKFRCFF